MAYDKLIFNYGKLVNVLDKEEFRIKLEQINTLVEKKDYKGAMEVVDSIDWRRVKNVRTLCIVGEIYAANHRYEDSREIFLLAYHRSSIGKNILVRLIDVSLKMNDVEDAEEFYDEFIEVAPNDNTKYVLKYRIEKEKNAPIQDLIGILEEYKDREFTEKWAYELAELYYRAGEKEKSNSLCSEIILWFNEGKYVMKCYDLKNRMGSLTDREKNVYESMKVTETDNVSIESDAEVKQNENNVNNVNNDTKNDDSEVINTESEENASENVDPEIDFTSIPQIDSIQIRGDKDLKDAETLQERISKGFRDIFGSKAKESEDENSDSELEKEEIQEEMIKDSSMTEDEIASIPELEKEDEVSSESKDDQIENMNSNIEDMSEEIVEKVSDKKKKSGKKEGIFGSLRHVPDVILGNSNLKDSLDIPEMPNLDKENTKKEDQNEKNEDIVSEENTDDAETKKTAKVFDFNSLEDTILAAASAQGIEIPEKEEATTSFPGPDEETAEDEELTEEDLRLAEEEFLNGPAPRKGTKEIKEPVVMDLESEESLTQKPETDEEDEEENSFINEILGIRKSPKKSSKKAEEEKKEKSEEITLEPEQETDKEEVKEENFDHTAELERFLAMFEDEDEEKEHIVYAREKQLSDEEKKLFTYFIKVPGMKEQLVEMLCKVQEGAIHSSSSTGNIMVMGGKETGKTRLISAIIPAICKQFGIEATKVAYVFAEQINGKDVKKMVEKLAGGFFVIENINQLDAATAEKLNEALSKDTKGMILIVEDEKIGMRKFIMKYPKLANKFSSMINIPVFTNDELVNFARVYTRENGFKIDQMGMLALYNLISENQKADEPMNIGVVKELLDNAIAKASGGLFKRKKKRMDRDGYIVLQEKDFI